MSKKNYSVARVVTHTQSTRQLTAEKVPTPYWYRYLRRGERASKFENQLEEIRWQWSLVSVRGILFNEAYIGNTVHYKCKKVSFKSKKNCMTTEDEWLRVENTHEPLISKDLWDLVHTHMNARKRQTQRDENNVFSGLVYCGECGWSLSSANCKKQAKYLRCTKYGQRGKVACSLHFTPFKLLYGVVLLRLQYWLLEVHQNQGKILDRLLQSGERQRETERKHYEKEIQRATKRKKDVDRLFVKTYEDFACGRLDEEKQTATKTTEENVRKWVDLISKYSEINELTAPILNELIDKIVVHEKRIDTDGKPTRDIEIYYRFVGRID